MRYGAFKYSLAKYGEAAFDTQLWAVLVDWNGDGAFDYVNESARMTRLNVKRGRRYLLSADGAGFEPTDTGELSIELDNSDGRFDPYNTNSPVYPNIRPGVQIQILTKLPDTGEECHVFTGTIDNIIPISSTARVRIIAVDGARWLNNQRVVLTIQKDQYLDDLIGEALAAAAWPWSTSLEASFDIVRWFWAPSDMTVWELLNAVASAHLGLFFIRSDGAACFYSRHHAFAAAKFRIEQEQVGTDVITRSPWEVIKNKIEVVSHPRVAQTTTVVWSLYDKPAVAAGETYETWGLFAQNGAETPISNYTTPVAGTDYTVNTLPDGTGTDLTSSCSLDVTVYANKAFFRLKNNSASNGYITLLQLRGTPLTPNTISSERSDAASIALYGPKQFGLDSIFLQDSNLAAEIATKLISLLKDPVLYPTIKIICRPELQYTVDLFDNIDLIMEKLGIAATYRIGHIEHEWLSENGQASETIFELEPVDSTHGIVWMFPTQIGIDSIFSF